MRLLSVGCIAATAASYASFAPTTAPRVGAPIHTALPDCGFRAVRQPLLRARRRRCAVEAHLEDESSILAPTAAVRSHSEMAQFAQQELASSLAQQQQQQQPR